MVGCLTLIWNVLGRRHRLQLFRVVFLICAGAIVQGIAPLALKFCVDALAAGGFGTAAWAVVGYVGLRFAGRLCGVIQIALFSSVERRVRRALTRDVYAHVLGLPHQFHLARRTGELDRTVADGLGGVRSVLAALIFSIVPVVIETGTIAAVLLHQRYDPVFLLIFVCFASAYGLAFRFGYVRQREAHRTAARNDAAASGVATDAILNHETVRLFGGEGPVVVRIDEALVQGEAAWLAFARARVGNALISSCIFIAALGAMLGEAVHQITVGSMTAGDFVLVNAYAFQIIGPMERLGFASLELVQGVALVDLLRRLLDEPNETLVSRQAATLAPRAPASRETPLELVLEDVWFGYEPCRPVLRGVSLRLPPGKTVAIVGRSGSGKSTLARLVFRLYEPSSGRVVIDGTAATDIALADLRADMAVVPQDTVLFNDTLFNNIAFGRIDAIATDVARAACVAGLDQLLAGLPRGLDTVVGERGLKLSGGEKQRVAIARAVLKDARLLVLDEATSALDTATEQWIQRNLDLASRGRSTLIIAHRLSTVTDADEILVLEAGIVVERGTHEALVERGGTYAAMWGAQRLKSDRSDIALCDEELPLEGRTMTENQGAKPPISIIDRSPGPLS